MRPVAEFQFMDFIPCAMNQISNMVAKTHYLWARPPDRPPRPQRRIRPWRPLPLAESEMWFVHNPGLKVICPATPYDAKGLIKAAIRDNNPCIFLRAQISLPPHQRRVPQTITSFLSAKPTLSAKAATSA